MSARPKIIYEDPKASGRTRSNYNIKNLSDNSTVWFKIRHETISILQGEKHHTENLVMKIIVYVPKKLLLFVFISTPLPNPGMSVRAWLAPETTG